MNNVDGVFLLVEDQDDDVQLMVRAVRKSRRAFRLEVVRDGAQALAYVRGDPPYGDRVAYPLPDLIILDLTMPGVDGYEVLRGLRSRPETQRTPVVIFSATGNQSAIGRTFRMGATTYFVKPVGSRAFQNTFREIEMFWRALAPQP